MGYGSLKVVQTGTIRMFWCGFLFAFYSNNGRIFNSLWDIQRRRYVYSFWMIYERDRQTDRQTDKQTDRQRVPAYTALMRRHFYVPRPSFLFAMGTRLWQSRKTLHDWKDNSVLAKPLAACTYLSSIVSELNSKVQQSPFYHIFCFPWGRPRGNHAKCCMDGKRIRCLQIVSLHVPI